MTITSVNQSNGIKCDKLLKVFKESVCDSESVSQRNLFKSKISHCI